jgi:hypothetical protein
MNTFGTPNALGKDYRFEPVLGGKQSKVRGAILLRGGGAKINPLLVSAGPGLE